MKKWSIKNTTNDFHTEKHFWNKKFSIETLTKECKPVALEIYEFDFRQNNNIN